METNQQQTVRGVDAFKYGAVYGDSNPFEQALIYYNQASMIRREIGDRVGEAMTLFNVSIIQEDLGEFESVQKIFEQALAIDSEINTPNITRDQDAIGRVQKKLLGK